MALPDLTGQNIQETYQRVVQTDGTNLAAGTGSLLPISIDGNASIHVVRSVFNLDWINVFPVAYDGWTYSRDCRNIFYCRRLQSCGRESPPNRS